MITSEKNENLIATTPESTPEQTKEESNNENILRPTTLSDYIGQEKIKANLEIFIEAAKQRQESLEHLLFYGPPGLGKTTISTIIAREMGANIKTTSGPAIEKSGDLASILSNLEEGDILFIDEIHRLRSNIEEVLYTAMEDYMLDIVIGKWPSARSMRIDLPQFTIIGATTKAASLSAPLRDRFGAILKLEFYNEKEIWQIIDRSAKVLDVQIDPSATEILATNSRKTPRIANRLIKRIRDIAQVQHQGIIDEAVAKKGLQHLQIVSHGLDHNDLSLLEALEHTFTRKPVGLNTLSANLSEEAETIEDVYEPYLLQLGFIERTPRGRQITQKGSEFLASLI